VSNTPLTDMLLISCDMDVPSYVMTRHARFIELKFNAANERIKRLEEAGDAMLNAWLMPEDSMEYCDWIALSADAKAKWYKAKEAKP